MSTMTNFLKRHALAAGVILMFLFTWPIDLANAGLLPFQVPFAVYLFLGWGFIFASVIMTGLTLGMDSVKTLLKRYMHWRVDGKWYLVAFFLGPVFIVAGVFLDALLTQIPPDFSTVFARGIFGDSANLWIFILPFFLVEIISNGEEIGWRGYILPRLQAKYNALTSTLILGVVWGFWHLPKFLAHWDTGFFLWFMVHIMAFAVLLSWLYNNTQGSLLIVAICHAASNTAGMFLPITSTVSSEIMGSYSIFVLLEVVAAALIVIFTGKDHLSQTISRQVQE